MFRCGLIILHNVIHLRQQGILLKVAETIKSWILAQSSKNDDLLHKLVSVHFTFWSLFRTPVSFPMRKINESKFVLPLIWAVTNFN